MKKSILLFFSIFLSANLAFSQTYQSAESVEYDPINKRWLASNGSSIIADDGYGNLSFFGNGSASHGMEVMGDRLFAISSNILRVFDLNTEMQIMTYSIPGVSFLNGITNDGGSNIYVTDFSAKKIYRIDVSDIDNISHEEIVANTTQTPNGVIYDGENNRLLFVTWGSGAKVRAVDLSNNMVTDVVNTGLGSIDGIDEDNAGDYYISSWSPAQISKYDKDFANPLEVITTPFISNPADIGYSLQNDTLAIPIGNDVVFVGFDTDSTTAVIDDLTTSLDFIVYPNPVNDQSYIQFELKQNEAIALDLLDSNGRHLRSLSSGEQSAGFHKILFAGHYLTPGKYYVQLKMNHQSAIKQILVLR